MSNMNDSTSFSGMWWLPSRSGKPEDTGTSIKGTLNFSPEHGGVLRLERSLLDEKSTSAGVSVQSFGGPNKVYPLILGRTDDNTMISLYQTNGSEDWPSSDGRFVYNTSLIIVSKEDHVYMQSASIRKVDVSYTYLFDWLYQTGFWRTNPSSGYEPEPFPPRTEVTPQGSGNSISATFYADTSKSEVAERRYSTYLSFETSKPMPLSDWNNYYLVPMCDLLTIATNKPNSITSVAIELDNGVKGQLFYRTQKNHHKPEADMISPVSKIFTLQDAAVEHGTTLTAFKEILTRWFSICNTKKMQAYQLLADNIYEPESTETTKLLRLTGAAEAYYAAVKAKTKAENKAAQKEKEIIKEKLKKGKEIGLTEQELERLNGSINKWSNAASLAECLDFLLKRTKSITAPLLVPFGNIFIKRVEEERGYHSHGGVTRKGARQKEQRLFIEILTFMMQASLLEDIGISSRVYKAMLRDNNIYNNASIGAKRLILIEIERYVAGAWHDSVLLVEDPSKALSHMKLNQKGKEQIKKLPTVFSEWSTFNFADGQYSIGKSWSGKTAFFLDAVSSTKANGRWSLSGGEQVQWKAERIDVPIPEEGLKNVWSVTIEPAANTPDLKEDIIGLRRLALIIDAWLETYPNINAEIKVKLGNVFTERPSELNLYPHLQGWPLMDIYATPST